MAFGGGVLAVNFSSFSKKAVSAEMGRVLVGQGSSQNAPARAATASHSPTWVDVLFLEHLQDSVLA